MAPRPPSASPRDSDASVTDLTEAKVRFINAAYAASPLRLVERRPLLAVTAVASTAMAATVIIGEPLIRSVGGGLATHGLGLLSTFARSRLAGLVMSRVVRPADQPVASDATTSSA